MKRITRRVGESIDFVDGRGYGSLSHKKSVRLLFKTLAEYEDIGLEPSEIAKLKDKQTPKKPIEKQFNANGDLIGLCSTCNEMWVIKYKGYCANCGQKLDWN